MDVSTLVTQDLNNLRSLFNLQNFDIRLVGRCVRDFLAGVAPKDIDLCTDATPEEQIAIYKQANIRYIETGLQHGTVTVVINDEIYEITSLRTDVETDGRPAKVAYTRDWRTDLERRDFTINAMSLTFDGELFDPFNGLNDLHQGLVAFVGNAEKRIQEDYLRILRWFRFRGRFGMSQSYSARRAVQELARGLENISRERVWSEVSKILAGNDGPYIMAEMHQMGVSQYINIDQAPNMLDAEVVHQITRNPVTVMVALYETAAYDILKVWKASRDEQDTARYLATFQYSGQSPSRLMAVDGISRDLAVELAALRQMDAFDRAVLETWEIPVFPVTGYDLIKLGLQPGPSYGVIMTNLKEIWADSRYMLTTEELLNYIDKSLF